MTANTIPAGFERSTRKAHGFTQGQLVEVIERGKTLRGRIYAVAYEGIYLAPEGSEWTPETRTAGASTWLGGVATKIVARPVDVAAERVEAITQGAVTVIEPLPNVEAWRECPECSEPIPAEDDLCQSCGAFADEAALDRAIDRHEAEVDAAYRAELPNLRGQHFPETEPIELVVIPCGAEKLDRPAPARELYVSAHFAYTLANAERYAELTGAEVRILSARYGLVELDTVLYPYDARVDELDDIDEASLIDTVRGQLAAIASYRAATVRTWLPAAYRDVIVEAVEQLDYVDTYDELAGCRGIGEQRRRMAELGRGEAGSVVVEYAEDAHELPAGGVTRDLIAAADAIEAAERELEAARAELAKLASFAIEAGKSEAWVSRTTGIRRGTLRSWLGKPAT